MMNPRQEPCRNFMRGSCKYGAQCKFLHVPQQQSKPNPFGFGTQNASQFAPHNQQQKPNPFGFGVQSTSSLSRNASDFGARNQGPSKPFENKWTRTSSVPSKQTGTQPQAALHTICTDPESCKQQIVEDFNEAPLWKLTCYGHRKSGPCDIAGDITFEELRATAYEEARQGHSLQSIIERERNLQNAKLIEFNTLLHKPNVPQTPSIPTTGSIPGPKNVTPLGGSQTNAPPTFTSFSQLGAASNAGPGSRATIPGTPATNPFGQFSSLQKSSQTSNGVEMKFGVQGPFSFGSHSSNQQPSGSLHGSSMFNFSITKATGSDQLFPQPSHQYNDIHKQSLDLLDGIMQSSSVPDQTSLVDKKEESVDDSVWFKETWSVGEIPLEEPPQRHIRHDL